MGSPNPGAFFNGLTGIAATSSVNAWAVGGFNNTGDISVPAETLILHWDGTTWKQVPSPNPGVPRTPNNFLTGVAATSATNAWAVGWFNGRSGLSRNLILRWDGHSWRQVPSPNPGTFDRLSGVAATSAGNAWAVGMRDDQKTVILHWNGSQWRQVASPSVGFSDTLTAVTATSATNAWAVGSYNTSGTFRTLIRHWNGIAWKRLIGTNAGPLNVSNFLYGVTATSPTSAWAVGSYFSGGPEQRALVLHWDGSHWRVVPSPNLNSPRNVLSAVAASSAANLWAVGFYDNGSAEDTLALHCC